MREIYRQGIHLFSGLFFAATLLVYGKEVLFLLAAGLLVSLMAVGFAAKKELHIPVIREILLLAKRKSENANPFFGALFFLLGIISVCIFFESTQVILGGILVLGVGDSFSTIVGKKFGRTKITRKHSFEGSLGGTVAAFGALLVFFPFWPALAAAVTGMLSELLCLEDNAIIPLAAATALALILPFGTF